MTKISKTVKILKGLQTPEKITLSNGKIIEQGVRLGPGEEDFLQYFSKGALDKLTEGGFIGEPDGIIFDKNSAGIVYTKNFLEGLISPRSIDRAAKLLTEHRLSIEDLEILKDKVEEVLSSGIDTPILKLLHGEIINQLYDRKILNDNEK